MMRSMTGFGQGTASTKKGILLVEISSINRKHLETSIFLPKEFLSMECDIKRWLSGCISRGQVTVRVSFSQKKEDLSSLLPDPAVLLSLKNEWEKIQKKLKLSNSIDLRFLIEQYSSFQQTQKPDINPYKKAIQTSFQEALDNLLESKEQEGQIIWKEIQKRLKTIEKEISSIQEKEPIAEKKYREKILQSLAEFSNLQDHDERILREVALFAEKIDISEEISRLLSHLHKLEKIASPKISSYGKEIEFFLQEMQRESNTLASKCSDLDISTSSLRIKSELEKIKEQVQNIE